MGAADVTWKATHRSKANGRYCRLLGVADGVVTFDALTGEVWSLPEAAFAARLDDLSKYRGYAADMVERLDELEAEAERVRQERRGRKSRSRASRRKLNGDAIFI